MSITYRLFFFYEINIYPHLSYGIHIGFNFNLQFVNCKLKVWNIYQHTVILIWCLVAIRTYFSTMKNSFCKFSKTCISLEEKYYFQELFIHGNIPENDSSRATQQTSSQHCILHNLRYINDFINNREFFLFSQSPIIILKISYEGISG